MNIINIEHISKLFGEKKIFDHCSLGIHEGDKIGIVGMNGTGKSTLLKILAGQEEAEEGKIVMRNGLRIAYLPQLPEFPNHRTVLQYVSEGNENSEWDDTSEAAIVLNHLGISDHNQRLENLSGGQKRKAALARTLVNSFDVLLLDEPTNHLDQEMVRWLEEYLRKFRGVLLMVTHDRYFLDRVSNKILEISHGNFYTYEGNYSKFLELKSEREEMELASERKRMSVLRMELEWAKRGCRARSTKQRARLERLEALKSGKAPVADSTLELESAVTRMGRKTVEVHHVGKSFGEQRIVRDFDYIFLKNQRIGIVGPNGCGKSTLLKMIAGLEMPDQGNIEIGETVHMSYFAQEVPDMNGSERVIDYIRDVAEFIQTRDGKISATMMLERFLFDSAMQYTPVSKLSGGEKRRLYLLKTLMEAPNVLLLDEPSNDLDIPTLTILEDYLQSFAGIVIAVSHDRYFLDNVVDRIFAFEDGELTPYEGGYTDYQEKLSAIQLQENSSQKAWAGEGSVSRTSSKNWKTEQKKKLKFTYMEQREFETIDEEIANLEEKIASLDQDMMIFATNSLRLQEIVKEKEELEGRLEEKMDRWIYLNDLAEKIEQQNRKP